MDDLYDNLENYHDENIIDELKSVNQDLKAKLEEYSSAMTRLQMNILQDFDKLSSDYKNLEMNYSSLLKTARAEIERKSELIKSLNTEKDLLIIKSLQTSGKNILNTRRHLYDTQRLKKTHEIDKKCGGKPGPQSSNQNEEKMHRNNRIHSTSSQSEYTIPDSENKSENFSEDKELRDTHSNFRNKADKSKENITKDIYKDDPVKRKGEKLSKRRKSMPFCRNVEPIFSSDDDFEALSLKNIRKSPLGEGDTRHFDKRSNENCSSKERFYSNKTNRYITHGKYSHDRYESGPKYTRHSPEKYRSKYTNQHSETHRSRGDYKNNRQRVLRSPPTDKYNHSKSRDRKTFEKESYHDYQEREHSAHTQDNAVKYRSKNELDEPSSKRQKTEHNKKGLTEQNDRDSEHSLRGNLIRQDFMESSCQSPDYINIENSIPQYIVKEIKHTAATPLEDPRISSKKYLIKTDKDKTVLTTVNSADVDIKPITVAAWNIPNFKTFMIPPTEQMAVKTNNDFVNEINMDIDSSLLNDSVESGEIQTDYEICHEKDTAVDKLQENIKSNNKDHSKTFNTLTDIGSDNIKNNVVNKYKIPKIKKPDKIFTEVKHEDLSLLSKKQDTAIEYGNENIEFEIENYGNVSTSLRETPNTKNEMIKSSAVLPEKTLVCTLAEDLELSDEASETRDVHNNAKKPIKIFSKRKPCMDSVDSNKQKQYVTLVNDEIINSEKGKSIGQLKKTPKDSCKDSGKTRKSKKKTELKDKICTETKVQKELQGDTKINSKPAISIETKNKFSDLFGDSSSLITPDDLGLPHPEIQLPLTDKYVSIYDNTQDAVDLSVADINGEKCNASKSSTFPMLPVDQSNETTTIEKTRSYTEKPQVYKDFVENTNANNLPEKNVCEKSAMNNDSEILKTVIISTGVQPKYTSENIPVQDSQECTDKIINVKTHLKTCMLNNIKALATSTPQKTEHVDISTPVHDATDHVPNVADDAITDNTNLSYPVSDASNPNEILNETDVPDVRLFVRRRRKVIKKP